MSTGTRRRQAVGATGRNKFASLSDDVDGDGVAQLTDNPIVGKVLEPVPHRKDDKSVVDIVTAITLVTQVLGLDKRPNVNLRKLNAELDMIKWDVDEQKQYSMNENVMVYNVKEEEGENAVDIVAQLVTKSRVECDRYDLSTVHRVGWKSTDRVRPLVAKFVRNDMRTDLLRKGRREREHSDVSWIKEARVYEHLTPWRSRLLRMVRDDEGVEKAWTR